MTAAPLSRYASVSERLLNRRAIDAETGCWLWEGSVRTGDGYGLVSAGGATQYVHRVAYQEWVGEIPTGLVLDHLCRVRHCFNPAHLEPVTMRENTMRSPIAVSAQAARQAACIHGHPYTPENTQTPRKGVRVCRECRRIQRRKYVAERACATGLRGAS